METLVIIVAVIVVIALIMSWRHHIKLKAFLLSPICMDKGILNKVKRLVGIDDAAIAGITLFDVLYNTLKLNPDLLRKLGELDHNQTISSISDLITNSEISNLDTDTVFDIWQHADYLVGRADMSIYNSMETTAAFGDDPIDSINSMFDYDYAFDFVVGAHDTTFDSVDLHGLFFHIPIYTIATKSIKNWQKVLDNHVTVPEAVSLTVLDVSTSAVGAIGGAKAGTKVGLVLAPKTLGISLILGPAIGSAIGLISGKWFSTKLKVWWHGGDFREAQREFEKSQYALKSNSALLRNEFLRNFSLIKKNLASKHRSNIQTLKLEMQLNENLLKRLFFPNAMSKALSMCIGEMKKEFRITTKPYYEKLLDNIAQSPESEGGLLIYAQGKNKLLQIGVLDEIYDQISYVLTELENKKEKVLREKNLLERKL